MERHEKGHGQLLAGAARMVWRRSVREVHKVCASLASARRFAFTNRILCATAKQKVLAAEPLLLNYFCHNLELPLPETAEYTPCTVGVQLRAGLTSPR
jgi:hypothetical protein